MKQSLVLAIAALLSVPAFGQAPDTRQILKGVEDRYNKLRSMKADYTQTTTFRGRKQVEKGVLYLSKPGKTRWEYSTPPDRLFITDGKYAYDYDPGNRRFERVPMKETEDLGVALGFLLGKLDFDKHFERYTARREGPNVYITAKPKSDKLLFTQIEMLIAPDSRLLKVIVSGQDFTTNEYVLENEQRDAKVTDAMFKPPKGVDFVELAQ